MFAGGGQIIRRKNEINFELREITSMNFLERLIQDFVGFEIINRRCFGRVYPILESIGEFILNPKIKDFVYCFDGISFDEMGTDQKMHRKKKNKKRDEKNVSGC